MLYFMFHVMVSQADSACKYRLPKSGNTGGGTSVLASFGWILDGMGWQWDGSGSGSGSASFFFLKHGLKIEGLANEICFFY